MDAVVTFYAGAALKYLQSTGSSYVPRIEWVADGVLRIRISVSRDPDVLLLF